MRSKTYCFKRLREDLVELGLRHRRGHDLRHTMITLAREDHADLDILKTITHDPGRKKSSSAIHAYIRYSWPVRCGEILKMRVRTDFETAPGGSSSGGPREQRAATAPLQTDTEIPAQAPESIEATYTPPYTPKDSEVVTGSYVVEAPGTAPFLRFPRT